MLQRNTLPTIFKHLFLEGQSEHLKLYGSAQCKTKKSAHTLWELRPNLTVYQSGPDTTFPNFMVILYFAFCNLITTIQEHKTKH